MKTCASPHMSQFNSVHQNERKVSNTQVAIEDDNGARDPG